MTNPQQPELARSRKGATVEDSAKAAPKGAPGTSAPFGPVPEDNLPGHHPEQEQDKPTGPPPVPPPVAEDEAPAAASDGRAERDGDGAASPAEPAQPAPGVRVRFPFAFDVRVAPLALMFGATPLTAWVDVDDRHLSVRFGPWSLRTSLDNVAGAERTGPYAWWKVAGPPHLSLADGGVTFATSTRGGVCVRFREPVKAALPFGLMRHPAVTVTVDDPDALVEALTDGG